MVEGRAEQTAVKWDFVMVEMKAATTVERMVDMSAVDLAVHSEFQWVVQMGSQTAGMMDDYWAGQTDE